MLEGKTEGQEIHAEEKKEEKKEEEEAEFQMPAESLVGKKLSDLTTRKVILIVLSMLLTAPLFIVTTFKANPDGAAIGLEMIAAFDVGTEGFNLAFENFIELYHNHRKRLLLVNAKNVIWESSVKPNSLRQNEKEIIFASHFEGG